MISNETDGLELVTAMFEQLMFESSLFEGTSSEQCRMVSVSLCEGVVINKELIDVAQVNELPGLAEAQHGAVVVISELSWMVIAAGICQRCGCKYAMSPIDTEPHCRNCDHYGMEARK
jgi:ribosomal protein L40E